MAAQAAETAHKSVVVATAIFMMLSWSRLVLATDGAYPLYTLSRGPWVGVGRCYLLKEGMFR